MVFGDLLVDVVSQMGDHVADASIESIDEFLQHKDIFFKIRIIL